MKEVSELLVQVKLFATLRQFAPDGIGIGESFTVEIEEGWTVEDLISHLNIPINSAKLIMIEGVYQTLDFVLRNENATVAIFPPSGGGYG